MKNTQQILDELKADNGFYINLDEWKWMGENKDLLKDAKALGKIKGRYGL